MMRSQFFARLACGLAILGALYAADRSSQKPRPFRQYPGDEYGRDVIPLPPDYKVPGEWVFARLMFPSIPDAHFRHAGWDWRRGHSSWTNDYPRADRHFIRAVQRLTRIDARSVEQPVNLDDGDDVYNWPWLYAVFVGEWDLTDAQAHKLRDYLLRGGFLMCDDFWGTNDWKIFEASMKRVFPHRPIVEIPNSDPIFHVVYDLDNRYQVAGEWGVRLGTTYRNDGYQAHWRGIYDDKGRLMVAMTFNSDVGDSWEWADDPSYPQKYSALGIRIGINYIVYAMTH
ncbi:MAG TPA: DUF4159 domain-containing protein [Bryobacteraceae bacterium]